jgi:2-dehydro-3-deoxygluconokinase
MKALSIRPAEICTFDQISLGEVMLRLDPGEGRIRDLWRGLERNEEK